MNTNDALLEMEQAAKSPLGPPASIIPDPEPAEGQNTIHAYKSDPPHESHFHPVAASVLLAEPPEEIEWILDEYLPAGGLVLLAGKPKEGKTTLCYELAVRVAQGLPFLGRQTRQGGVLILALEENKTKDVMLRAYATSERPRWKNLYVHAGAVGA